jgi:membrane protease YdiL (CAAX protease family)
MVWEEARASLLAWSILALLTALPVLGLWLLRGKRRSLFPPQRRRLAPWTGFEVCLVFFLTQLLLPAFLYLLLNSSGFFNWLYGAGFDSAPGSGDKLAAARRGLWVMAFAFPCQLAGMLIILRGLSGTRLYQLGLTTKDAARNVVIGWLAWLLLTLPIIAVHLLVVWACWVWEGALPEEHALARLAQAHPSGIEWALIIFLSVVMAPIMEELLFRRVLLGWSATRPWGGAIILVAALALSLANPWLEKTPGAQDKANAGSVWHDLEPALFVLIMVPGCFLGERLFRRWLPQPYIARAIYSTALLFAVSHIWPTPVPLFLLALGLGYLAYRTQNLVAPMVFHALFNGVACVTMLLTYAGPANGKETTSADRRLPSASTSRIVPGSWLPRRTYASAIACPSLGETTDEVMWPTSLSARKSFAPGDRDPSPATLSPVSERLTWP